VSALWLHRDSETSGCCHSRFRSQEIEGHDRSIGVLVIVSVVQVFAEAHDSESVVMRLVRLRVGLRKD
jgi:hypothetical protein